MEMSSLLKRMGPRRGRDVHHNSHVGDRPGESLIDRAQGSGPDRFPFWARLMVQISPFPPLRAWHNLGCTGPSRIVADQRGMVMAFPNSDAHMAIKTAEELFVHELSDIYSAEKQLTKALPRLARAAENPDLAAAFETHLEETQGQIERIDQVVEVLGIRLKRIKCAAMEGLVEEGKEVIDSIEKGPVRDAALIGGAQKVEHYEIASYGTIAALAKQLGYKDALPYLLETLEEEKATDEKLTLLAEQGGNQKAASK